jgi:hypothetical protein
VSAARRDREAEALVLRVLRRSARGVRSERRLRRTARRSGVGAVTLGNALGRLAAAGRLSRFRLGGEDMVALGAGAVSWDRGSCEAEGGVGALLVLPRRSCERCGA